MRYFAILLIFIFIGCGGGGGGDKKQATNPDPNPDPNKPIAKPINDPYFSQQWHLAKNSDFYRQYGVNENAHVNGGEYYKFYRGKGVKIAVIDDGLQINHPDLQGAITKTYNVTTGGTDVTQNGVDNHGTLVTGVIAAQANNQDIFGLASESEIVFLKYGTSITSDQIVKLFKKADEFGADIISCSWGTYNASDAVKDMVQHLAKNGRGGKGTLIVFASGNDNIFMGNDESAIPEVIAVGATTKNNQRATYSNYGKNLDIVAPGGSNTFGILSLNPTYLKQNSNLALLTGTSLSTPIVSGALAMLLQAKPNLTRVEVESLLKATNDKIGLETYDENGHNILYGHGKLNIAKLLDKALGK